MSMRNLPMLTPKKPLVLGIERWAKVTQVSPLRIQLDGETSPLAISVDNLLGTLAINDRVLVTMVTNDNPKSKSSRIVIIGKSGGHSHDAADSISGTFPIARIPTGTSSSTVSLGNHTHTTLGENGVAGPATTSGTDTRANAAYANMAGTGSVTSFNLVKALTSTRVRVDLSVTFYTSISTSGGRFGVLIDGVDYDVCQLRADISANNHHTVTGFIYIPASTIAAGTWSVQGRWLRTEGAGTLSRDFNDWLAISAREII